MYTNTSFETSAGGGGEFVVDYQKQVVRKPDDTNDYHSTLPPDNVELTTMQDRLTEINSRRATATAMVRGLLGNVMSVDAHYVLTYDARDVALPWNDGDHVRTSYELSGGGETRAYEAVVGGLDGQDERYPRLMKTLRDLAQANLESGRYVHRNVLQEEQPSRLIQLSLEEIIDNTTQQTAIRPEQVINVVAAA